MKTLLADASKAFLLLFILLIPVGIMLGLPDREAAPTASYAFVAASLGASLALFIGLQLRHRVRRG